ncbi:MAG: hypothetical protein BYD32DRAFT_438968 [Podila humilis]|nr:MAG: hypothetical protein BYD32DRAFT_438968 [Podila humilis]
MFDIPELNEMVLLLLDQNPWPDVRESAKSGTMSPAHTSGESSPCLHAEAKQHRLEQQHQRRDQPPAKKARKSAQVVKSANKTSELTKPYPPCPPSRGFRTTIAASGTDQSVWLCKTCCLSAPDLAHHFFKHCPHALLAFETTYDHVKSAILFSLALELLSRVNTLIVRGSNDHRQLFPETKVKQILGATSKHLHSLTIQIIEFREAKREDCWTHLR